MSSSPAIPTVELALMHEPLSRAAHPSIDALLDPELGEACWAGLLARWLADLQAELPPSWQVSSYSLSLSLVDDAGIAALNRDWRQIEGPTDVLAFAALEEAAPLPAPQGLTGMEAEPLELGDIVISLDTARRQACEAGNDLRRELLFLASHGLLHLLGWDHPDEASLEAMLSRQDRLIQLTDEAI